MFVIVGLGNPGRKYEATRHNLGFIAIDFLAEDLGVSVNKLKHKALIGQGMLGDCRFMLVKPQTYMNLSGESVGEIVRYYHVEPEALMVLYDDLDFPAGAVRIRKKGSAGSHNGMKSIIGNLGFNNFPRVRMGIGGNLKEKFPGDVKDFVIGNFTEEEAKLYEKAVRIATDSVKCYITDGIDKAMNKYNGNS